MSLETTQPEIAQTPTETTKPFETPEQKPKTDYILRPENRLKLDPTRDENLIALIKKFEAFGATTTPANEVEPRALILNVSSLKFLLGSQYNFDFSDHDPIKLNGMESSPNGETPEISKTVYNALQKPVELLLATAKQVEETIKTEKNADLEAFYLQPLRTASQDFAAAAQNLLT